MGLVDLLQVLGEEIQDPEEGIRGRSTSKSNANEVFRIVSVVRAGG